MAADNIVHRASLKDASAPVAHNDMMNLDASAALHTVRDEAANHNTTEVRKMLSMLLIPICLLAVVVAYMAAHFLPS
jgi:hypothetical protein